MDAAPSENPVELVKVDADNWRTACELRVFAEQADFVAPVAYYLALCAYGDDWHPLAITAAEDMVGFAMWAIDEADNSFWIGGLLVDADRQRRGFGRAAVERLIDMAAEHGCPEVALSYQPSNPARKLYAAMDFVETGEMEDDEVVARRRV
jgi:diamine N-acetyltransferase